MTDLIDRIGIPMFIQIIIESWNELILLILIITMLIGTQHHKIDAAKPIEPAPMKGEIVTFYHAAFLYNLCDIMDIAFGGMPMAFSYWCIRIGVFVYYAVGGFQTLFFLQVLKKHIAVKQDNIIMKNAISVFQILQIPLFLLLLVTPFTGALYQIDPANNYSRSWGYLIWQSMTIITFVFIAVVILACWRKTDRFLKKIIITAVSLPLIGLIGSFFIDVSLNNIMVAVMALVLFVLYERNKTEVNVRNAYELEKSKQELEQSKVRLLVAQIQPHFIYNSLMALQARSIDNPVVYEGIKNFGDYLRSNFTAIKDNELISFEDELKCIKAYLQLEHLNFGDKMKVEYDLELNRFMLPALCVEPLVENAVRYGIGTYEEGGTVKIIVRDETDYIEIEVKDDGSGRNKLTDVQKNRKSIGLENVRLRLKASGMGELILSQDETGTSAIVRLKYIEV